MAVLDSPWAVLKDCQRNKPGWETMMMLRLCKVEKSTKTLFWTVLRDLSWDQREDLGLVIAVLDRS